ncbi:MAG: substrate-binding domain-containing protein [Kiritimatiellaeota bacterium]|nr:substrate-binding domain-containing protein [Kiritimatiellota bacterium]
MKSPKAKFKYQRLAEVLEAEIYASFKPGELFTPQETLAERHFCNRATVNKAVIELARGGLLLPEGRKGTRVADFRNVGFDPRLTAIAMPIKSHMWDKLYGEISCALGENERFVLALDTSEAAKRSSVAEKEMFQKLRKLLTYRPRTLIVSTEMDINRFMDELGQASGSFRNLIWLHDRDISSCGIQCLGQVSMDLRATWRLLVKSALLSGYKKIALFVQNLSFLSDTLKAESDEVLASNGLSTEKASCFFQDDFPNSLDTLIKLARNSESLAVICTYDYGAHLVTGALRAAGISIPERAGVYGVNNTPWSEQGNLTSVGYDTGNWARKIVKCIEILDKGEERARMPIKPRLIQRLSTKPQ